MFWFCWTNAQNATFQTSFRVDMTQLKSTFKTLAIRGNIAPLSWQKDLIMSDLDKNGIFEIEINWQNAALNSIIEYKYILDNSVWETLENRAFLLNQNPLNLPIDEWNKPQSFQPTQFPLLSAEELQADFAIVQKAYLSLHPGLYRYNTEAEMAEHFKKFAQIFQKPMPYGEAYLNFSKLLGKIRCGHTYANFYNQNQFIKHLVFNQADKLPFCFRIIDKRLIITHNLTDNQALSPGAEILAINDIPINQILDSLLNVVKADGDNDGKRLKDLEISGLGKFESFDIYFPLFFPPKDGQYKIQVNEQNLWVKPISRQARKELLQTRFNLKESTFDELWQFEILDSNTAYLRLGSFVTWQMKMDWRAFLKNAFAEIRKKSRKNFVLDIRDNEGGNDEVIYEIVKFLAKKPLKMPASKNLVRYKTLPSDLARHLSSWEDSYKDFSDRISTSQNNFYELKNKGELKEIAAQKNAFSGKTYLLINSANSSATFYLAKILKDNTLATLVGQTTGGSQRGLNGGQTAFLVLPNSKIEMDIPLIGTFYDTQQSGGIEPNIFIKPSLDDIKNNLDTELEAVKKIIQKGS